MAHVTEGPKTSLQQSHLRPYHTPRLKVYGSMRALTASGSGRAKENKKQGAVARRP